MGLIDKGMVEKIVEEINYGIDWLVKEIEKRDEMIAELEKKLEAKLGL